MFSAYLQRLLWCPYTFFRIVLVALKLHKNCIGSQTHWQSYSNFQLALTILRCQMWMLALPLTVSIVYFHDVYLTSGMLILKYNLKYKCLVPVWVTKEATTYHRTYLHTMLLLKQYHLTGSLPENITLVTNVSLAIPAPKHSTLKEWPKTVHHVTTEVCKVVESSKFWELLKPSTKWLLCNDTHNVTAVHKASRSYYNSIN